jgi:1-deoxy-D-xylulose-5-phosphate reductoisomerase
VRSLTIMGATGSVGRSTLALLAEEPERWEVLAVTAHRDATGLAAAARRTRARLAVVADPAAYPALKEALAGSGIEAAAGPEALIVAAQLPAQMVMAAIVGAAGLAPTLTALRRGAMVALANKECLVCAGALMLAEARMHGGMLLPVDSEHNAIFQAMAGASADSVEKLILTASGGPFRRSSREAMAKVTPAQAVAHPNWSMGAKISVDSATMMNKGLEVIEAHWLFGVPEPAIEVVVHPQSIVHSLVAYKDGSLLAQLGAPDMRIPIAHVLGWPERLVTAAPRLDLTAVARLDFEAPDEERFPALALARCALRAGGAGPTILNAANEVAVQAFLDGRLGFLEVVDTVAAILDHTGTPAADDLGAIAAWDAEARRLAAQKLGLATAAHR